MKKQLFLFGLGIGLMFSSIALPTFASENQNIVGTNEETPENLTYVEETAHILQAGYFDIIPNDGVSAISISSFSLTSSQESAIASALSNRQTEIDVSSYKIPKDDLKSIYSGLINSHPELYFVKSQWSYQYSPSSNYVTSILPTYYDGLGYAKDKAAFNKAAQKALKQTEWATNDLEKLLALHNYLTLHCEYAPAYGTSSFNEISHSAYGALVNGDPVCSGYALAYKYLLNQLGIECYYVTSDSMNHAWNMVKLNGSYYHIDVTWDDPTYKNIGDLFGRMVYNFFLLSDNTISDSNHEHKDWTISDGGTAKNLDATSTAYENYAWKGIRSDIVKYNNHWYYIDYTQNAIIKNSSLANTTNASRFYNLSNYWSTEYLDSLTMYEDNFYFTAKDGIYKLSKDGASCEKFISSSAANSIAGCILDDYMLKYKQDGKIQTKKLADPPETEPDIDPDEPTPPSREPDEEMSVLAPIYNLNITNVVVPTNLGIAFNPNGATITKKTGVTSTDQIVSLNYGIIQKSSKDKKITVNFTVKDENNQITFAADENQVKTAADHSYVVYLQAIPSTEITVDNAKPTHTTTAAKLCDVDMKEDTSHAVTASTEGFTFIMDKASYAVTGDIELGTGNDPVNNNISNKVSVQGLGTNCSSAGFTFTGSMNTNTDWSKLTKGITISVSYDIEDIYHADTYGLVTE